VWMRRVNKSKCLLGGVRDFLSQWSNSFIMSKSWRNENELELQFSWKF
jgi:hypothetical protein